MRYLSVILALATFVAITVNLLSYITFFSYSFKLCLALLILFSVLTFFTLPNLERAKVKNGEPLQFYLKWPMQSRVISIVLLAYAIGSGVIGIYLLNDKSVVLLNEKFMLEKDSVLIKQVSLIEFERYEQRVSRIFSAALMLFYFALYNMSRYNRITA
ncbi:hypothetical protein EC844_11948 [Acinetobacter calcoaceticus]|uniref:Uncharacterized protein n=1 Tax=Acinetobacter calcoaceticus TaxID=471 RepID=A0A4R1XIT7_ACICA|nr:hypothetical protein EC844_11948 [Acinetobacter calcoaceticus]